jgi:hypothetical protein
VYGINRLSIVGWSLVLIGILLILANTSNGGRPEWLFNVGILLMVAGSVLRVYGKFNRGKK